MLYSLVVYEFLKGVNQKYQKIRQIGNHRVAQNIIYDCKETTYSQLQFARKSGNVIANRLNLICSNLQQFSVHFAFASVYLEINLLVALRIFYNCLTFLEMLICINFLTKYSVHTKMGHELSICRFI